MKQQLGRTITVLENLTDKVEVLNSKAKTLMTNQQYAELESMLNTMLKQFQEKPVLVVYNFPVVNKSWFSSDTLDGEYVLIDETAEGTDRKWINEEKQACILYAYDGWYIEPMSRMDNPTYMGVFNERNTVTGNDPYKEDGSSYVWYGQTYKSPGIVYKKGLTVSVGDNLYVKHRGNRDVYVLFDSTATGIGRVWKSSQVIEMPGPVYVPSYQIYWSKQIDPAGCWVLTTYDDIIQDSHGIGIEDPTGTWQSGAVISAIYIAK